MSVDLQFIISLDGISMKALENKYKAGFYEFLESYSGHSYMKLSGIGTGLVTGFLTVAFKTAFVAEAVIKGFVHLIGSFFRDDCTVRYGVAFLFLGLVGSVGLLLSPIEIIERLAMDIIGMAKDPSVHIKETKETFTHWYEEEESNTIPFVSSNLPQFSNLPEGNFRTTYEKITSAHDSKQYKDLFNLGENYTANDVDRGFRRLCAKIHPDKNPDLASQGTQLVKFLGDIKKELLKGAYPISP